MKKFVDPNHPYRVRRRRAPKGAPLAFIEDALLTETDDCIRFPYCCNGDGYARLKYEGKDAYGHVIVCTRAHGQRPTASSVVAHGCGNQSCINKRHLRWASSAENAADKAGHGTSQPSKLPQHAVDFIGSELVHVMRYRDLARMYGVSGSTIASIARKAAGGPG
ncbi:HNH endonuclease [Mesorhizobium sp.]|uniref:HNH endonuclease n=1 Tax=Mesorhizobium sp. TaxID=1871066 RepID=UPI0025F83489|nr:HNH endonuclease [Mesorhizobium sp.]